MVRSLTIIFMTVITFNVLIILTHTIIPSICRNVNGNVNKSAVEKPTKMKNMFVGVVIHQKMMVNTFFVSAIILSLHPNGLLFLSGIYSRHARSGR